MKSLNYRLVFRKMPTRERIARKRGPRNCLFCNQDETENHLFLTCDFFKPLRRKIVTGTSLMVLNDFNENTIFYKIPPDGQDQEVKNPLYRTLFYITSIYTYVLWRARCDKLHHKIVTMQTIERNMKAWTRYIQLMNNDEILISEAMRDLGTQFTE